MSLILALDSSTDACSVALNLNGEILALDELAAKSHTQRLLPMVDALLQQANIDLAQLDAIAFGCGPGSFTGLRICMGIVQGLAFGAQLPVIPVSTLAAMGLGYYRVNPGASAPVLVALDARMEEVYWGLFEPRSSEVQALLPEQVMRPELLAAELALLPLERGFAGVGSGWHYAGLAGLTPSAIDMTLQPSAQDIAAIAALRFAAGEVTDILQAEPVYLRNSVSWQKRQRIRTPEQLR
jgi:tRNA threonylcarbamoyladenosine biosynthesis protein TsaB